MFIGFTLIITSCDNRITQSKEQSKILFPIPASGIAVLPQTGDGLLKSENPGTSSQQKWSGYAMLEDYAEAHPDHPYAAIAGQWDPQNQQYVYNSMQLQFPDSLKEDTDHPGYFKYQLRDSAGTVYRTLAALIPPNKKALKYMHEWLKFNDPSKIAALHIHPITTESSEQDFNHILNETSANVGDIMTNAQNPSEYQTCGDLTTEGCALDEMAVSADRNSWDYTGWYEYTPAWPGGGTGGSTGASGSGGGGSTTGTGTGGNNDDPPCGDPVHGCAGEDIGNNSSNNITINPEFKFPEGSNYATIYPKFTEYVKNKIPTLKDNNTIIDALKKYGDLSTAEIKESLEWGKGPTIKIVQLDLYQGCDQDCLGQYSSADPNSLLIDIDLVDDLENTTIGSGLANSFSFLAGVTLLHEFVHFSEYTDGAWNNPESGELFEEDAYGQTVWRRNASIILKKNGR